MIYRRRSVRRYSGRPVSDAICTEILARFRSAQALRPEIRVEALVVEREDVRFYLPWKAPRLVAVYSEDRPGYLEEVGFRLQQVDLYIQSLGLGSCWLGSGKMRKDAPQVDGLRFVVLLAFGEPCVVERSDVAQFNRRSLEDISDRQDERLEPARLAPSSTNSQPWYFLHGENQIHAYCAQAGMLRHRMLGDMNRIDMGIALAHLYVSYPETFSCFQVDAPEVKGHRYVCSIRI